MASEKFSNRPASTVAVAYTATDLTLEVADSSDFPSTGVFRVILGNTEQTIFRVDSVSGNVFTGAAEEFDGDAAIGVTVKIVASKAVAERLLQAPSSNEIQAYSGLLGVDRHGPLWRLTPFVSGDFGAWSGGTVVESIGGGIARYSLASETLSIRTKTKAIGSLTYTAAILIGHAADVDFNDLGICFRESATSKVVSIAWSRATTVAIAIRKGTQPTTHTSRTAAVLSTVRPSLIFLQTQYDGATTSYRYSYDGVNFVTLLSEPQATHFTAAPDEVGLCMENSSGVLVYMSVLGWNEA